MTQLIVCNLEDEVKERLAARARLHGHNMEEEVRKILRDAVKEGSTGTRKPGLGMQPAAAFDGRGQDLEIPQPRGDEVRPVDYGD
jgi:antitoxin FitA